MSSHAPDAVAEFRKEVQVIMGDQQRYYEDLVVDQQYHLGERRISREEIIDFARSWDPQSFHVDDQAAGDSIFGGLTGSSLHSMCLMSLAIAAYPQKARLVAAIKVETMMHNPLRPDETLSFSTTILDKRRSRSRKKIGVVHERNLIANSRGETIIEQNVTALVECRYDGDPVG